MEVIKVDIEDLHKVLEKMDAKLDSNHKETQDRCNSIDSTLINQGKDLEYHIKRTNLLEDELQTVKKDVEPVRRHVDKMEFFIKWSFKIIGGSGILTIMGYVIKTTLGL